MACHTASCPDDDAVQSIQISNLLTHHNSTSHSINVAHLLGRDVETSVTFAVPSKQLFKELYNAFRSGIAPTAGYTLHSGNVSFEKANSMLWVLNEAHCDIKREQLANAFSMNLEQE